MPLKNKTYFKYISDKYFIKYSKLSKNSAKFDLTKNSDFM